MLTTPEKDPGQPAPSMLKAMLQWAAQESAAETPATAQPAAPLDAARFAQVFVPADTQTTRRVWDTLLSIDA